jgi:hypothetical protein
MTPELEQQIHDLVLRVLMPTPLMNWMEGLTNAERVGRIARARIGGQKVSVLRYGIERYVQSQLPEMDRVWRLRLYPMDTEIIITGRNPTVEPEQRWEIAAPYPQWLLDFFEDDTGFDLLMPECEDKLGEVLQKMYEWCWNYSPTYRKLVQPT